MTGTIRIAAVADIHVTKTSAGMFQAAFADAAAHADVLLLCGDLTDYGVEEEAKILANDLKVADDFDKKRFVAEQIAAQ